MASPQPGAQPGFLQDVRSARSVTSPPILQFVVPSLVWKPAVGSYLQYSSTWQHKLFRSEKAPHHSHQELHCSIENDVVLFLSEIAPHHSHQELHCSIAAETSHTV